LLADNDPAHWHSIGEAYERGANLLASQSELDYLNLIQARELETTTTTTTVTVPSAGECVDLFLAGTILGADGFGDCVENNNIAGTTITTTLTTSNIIVHPSDGLVPEWSQLFPNAINNLEVEGGNHFEYFNHPRMTEQLDFILNEVSAPHPFFRTITD